MFKPHQDRDLLVVRPWTTHYSGTDSYGHFDAIVMRQRGLTVAERYGDLDVLHRGDGSGKGPLLDGFRFECQIDERRPEAYACRWGYAGNQSGLFTADDLARYGKSIAAIERGLRRAAETDGDADSVGTPRGSPGPHPPDRRHRRSGNPFQRQLRGGSGAALQLGHPGLRDHHEQDRPSAARIAGRLPSGIASLRRVKAGRS